MKWILFPNGTHVSSQCIAYHRLVINADEFAIMVCAQPQNRRLFLYATRGSKDSDATIHVSYITELLNAGNPTQSIIQKWYMRH